MAWISLVFFVATVAGALPQSLPGGYGETNFVTPYVRQVVFSVRHDLQNSENAYKLLKLW